MKQYLVGLVLGLLSLGTLADIQDIYIAPGNVVDVYDGDTFKINLPGTIDLFGKGISVRIVGINTPELNSTCIVTAPVGATVEEKDKAALDQLNQRVAEKAKAITARTLLRERLATAKTITLEAPGRDKYFRILAKPYVDGVSIASVMVAEGVADLYDGGTKRSWCGR